MKKSDIQTLEQIRCRQVTRETIRYKNEKAGRIGRSERKSRTPSAVSDVETLLTIIDKYVK